MKQKISIARTIAHNPPMLIFDEPTIELDVLNAIEMQKIITELQTKKKTILFSTHIMSKTQKLYDRIAIIHRNRIHTYDTLTQLQTTTKQHYLEEIFVHYVERANTTTIPTQLPPL